MTNLIEIPVTREFLAALPGAFWYVLDGNIVAVGDRSANTLMGDCGNDVLFGRGGRDSLDGQDGNDILLGGWGRDTLHGGAGDDILDGGRGADVIYGGGGADTFVMHLQQRGKGPVDTIADLGADDRIVIALGLGGDNPTRAASGYRVTLTDQGDMQALRINGQLVAHVPDGTTADQIWWG